MFQYNEKQKSKKLNFFISGKLVTMLEHIENKNLIFYFLNKLSEEKLFDNRYTADSFICLNTHILCKILGQRNDKSGKRKNLWYDVKDVLLKLNIIEIDYSYSANEYSRGYRLKEQYRYDKLIKIECTDSKLTKRVNQHRINELQKHTKAKHIKFIYNNLAKISINYTGAIEFINETYSNKSDNHKYNCCLKKIEKIKEKNFDSFRRDTTGNRLHNVITNFPRELRTFISYNNKKLVNNDVRNSQPLFFNILLDKYYKNNLPEDVKHYKVLTSKGLLYEYLMGENNFGIEDRTKFKKNFFEKTFYCNIYSNRINPESKLFKKLFPNVFKVVIHYKAQNYKNLSIQMQKAESDLILDKIVKRISIENPSMFVLTIHDSIISERVNQDYINSVMQSEFNKLSIYPSINSESIN